ncbi:MAG: V-type ATP synthase subunit I [Candidatus Thermoplasmatota archaeon]|nr:V-type ATP synthase subunit I [Candidatus Thermoplasmatota archaeon]
MFRPEQMTRVVVVGSMDSLDATIECLFDLGALHLIDFTEGEDFNIGQPFPRASPASQKLLKLRAMIRALEIDNHKPSQKMSVEEIEETLDQALVTMDLNISGKVESKQRIHALVREKESEIRALEPFSSFGLRVEDFVGYESVSVLAGLCKADPEASLKAKIGEYELFKSSAAGGLALALFVRKDRQLDAGRILGEHGFQEIKFPEITGRIDKVVDKSRADVVDLQKDLERIESELESSRKRFADRITASEEHLAIEVMKAETPLRIATSQHSFVIDGWMPTAKVEEIHCELEETCSGLAFIETTPADHEDEPPVKLRNPFPARPFEFFISLVSTPRYRELDPTLVLFVTFPLFFGFMIGDIGFGIGLFLLGLVMRLKLKEYPDLKRLGTIILAGGLVASVFGLFVFAEAFGVPFHPPEGAHDEHSWEVVANIPIHPMLDKMHDIKELLAISILAGWLHLTLGFVFGFMNHMKHNMRHALAKLAWLPILFGMFAEMMVIAGNATATSEMMNATVLALLPDVTIAVVGTTVSIPAVLLIVAGVVALPFTEGALALTEVIGLFTNLVSYTRLAALAVGKGAMALAFNTMLFPLIFDSGNIGIAIAGALALFVTQMFFVFFLGALSAGIQAIRLNYVEFFLKFFEGGGVDFEPLKYERRHSTGKTAEEGGMKC